MPNDSHPGDPVAFLTIAKKKPKCPLPDEKMCDVYVYAHIHTHTRKNNIKPQKRGKYLHLQQHG